MSQPPRIAFVASSLPEAQQAMQTLMAEHGQLAPENADLIVALGGDGFMLRTLHRHRSINCPVFGMKLGTVGFLMNQYRAEGLLQRLASAQPAELRPLEMEAVPESGTPVQALAFNEVSLLRQTKQAAKIRISINGHVRIDELVCDGALVSTPAGSSAYNLSAHGPILPLDSDVLALTPLAAFRPRRWRGAILRSDAEVRFDVLDHFKRPVSATADAYEVRDVVEVIIRQSQTSTATLLFDPEHSLAERIMAEQFTQ